jgi:hypothetical protein
LDAPHEPTVLKFYDVGVGHALCHRIPVTSGRFGSTEDFDTASEALQIAIGLQRGGESIKYSRTPEGEDVSMGQLKTLVDGGGKPWIGGGGLQARSIQVSSRRPSRRAYWRRRD